jgi:hypothetical protein
MSDSQTESILRHLKAGHAISPLDALRRYGCMRLGARIWDLRQAGHRIERRLIDDGRRRYAEYRMGAR